jgi:serine/threonine protein kinase
LIGDESKKYLAYKEAGGGSYGEVYQVLDIPSLSARAIKVATPSTKDEHWRDRFIAEGSTLISLLSQNFGEEVEKVYSINKVHDGKRDNKFFLVKNWVKGETLQSRFEDEGHKDITDRLAIDIIKKTIAILRKLHSLQPPVYHRDLKPNNIMISFDADAPSQIKNVTIIDFGLCKSERQEIGTSLGHHAGNPIYQSCNMVNHWDTPNSLDDFYSILQTYYWLLFGTHPYRHRTRKSIENMKKKGRDSFFDHFPKDFPEPEKYKNSIILFKKFYYMVRKYFDDVKNIKSTEERNRKTVPVAKKIGSLFIKAQRCI